MNSLISTITISRMRGSLGTDIGQEVARRLNYTLAWRDLVNQAALRGGVPEMALVAIDDLGLLSDCASQKACLAYRQALEEVMGELANAGRVVIIGRAGQIILQGRPDVLHVQVIAPAELRAERLAAKHEIALEGARAQVETSDRRRRSFLRRFYHVRWDDPLLYDLVLNTGRLAVTAAAKLICQTIAQPLENRPPEQESF